MANLPKYATLNTGRSKTLTYKRRYPKDVATLLGKSHYVRPLGVKPPPASSDSEIARAVERASELFELKLRQVRNSDTAVFSDREVDLLAAEIIRREGLRAGQFAGYDGDWGDPASEAVGAESDAELWAVGTPLEGKVKPTVEQMARQRAAQALMDAKNAPKTKLLSELLADFQKHKNEEGKALKDRTRYWNKAMAYIGDTFATPDALAQIHAGLDEWMEQRCMEVTPASAQREVGSVVAVLNWASKRFRINWAIQTPELPEHTAKTKYPLSREEQRKLLATCKTWDDPVAAVILVMLQGGMMPTEVGRLDMVATADSLTADNPHVLIGYDDADTKTESRKRIVPIVVEPDLIREHLTDGIKWAGSVKDPSATINKRLRAAGFGKTGHSLRHTLSANIKSYGLNTLHGAMIAGWKADSVIPEHMMHYGAEGVSDYIEPLVATSRQAHAHLLTATTADNVVSLHSA